MRRALTAAAALLALVALAVAANSALRLSGWAPRDEAPAARAARLAAHWRILRPAGDAPAPVAILMSGCDGPADNMALWAEALTRAGWASVILDSHAPRGLDGEPRWRLVCSGQALAGAERAGDAAAAMAALEGVAGLDASRILLLGASHGGWTAAELLTLADAGTVPPGLTAWPLPPGRLRERVAGVVLLYPYCGAASGAAGGWAHPAPVLMILAGRDEVVSAEACRETARALAARGVPVEAVTLPDAGHGFDQRERSPLSPLAFDAEATRRAKALVDDLARGLAAPP